MWNGLKKAAKISFTTSAPLRKPASTRLCASTLSTTDTANEIAAVKRLGEAAGARVAVSRALGKRAAMAALEFADAVVDACNEEKRVQAAV